MRALDILIQKRAADRLREAQTRADRIMADALAQGVEMMLVGSLARNDFHVHSDIDLLVRGPLTPTRRAMIEKLVAQHMRGAEIPYDLIYEADLTPDRLRELLHDVV